MVETRLWRCREAAVVVSSALLATKIWILFMSMMQGAVGVARDEISITN